MEGFVKSAVGCSVVSKTTWSEEKARPRAAWLSREMAGKAASTSRIAWLPHRLPACWRGDVHSA